MTRIIFRREITNRARRYWQPEPGSNGLSGPQFQFQFFYRMPEARSPAFDFYSQAVFLNAPCTFPRLMIEPADLNFRSSSFTNLKSSHLINDPCGSRLHRLRKKSFILSSRTK